MSDPVTIGAIASLVLSMGAEAAVKGAIGEAAKDAYKALKEKISHWASGDIEALERTPGSTARRAVVAEVVDELPEKDKVSVKALATALADALKEASAKGPIGIDIGVLEAARVKLGKITVTEGVGMRADEVKTTGDFELDELNVGKPPGKSRAVAGDPGSAAAIGAMFEGAVDIGRDAIFGTKLAIHGGLHLYSSLPEHEQTFARKCLGYRDKRVGNPKSDPKNRLGDIYLNRTPAHLPNASFTAIHIFSAGSFDEGNTCDLDLLWSNEALLADLNSWEPPANWRHVWKLEKRFNNDGLLLFHDKIDYCEQYIQFHETGLIEAVDHGLPGWSLHHSRVIPAHHWENGVLGVLRPLLGALKMIGGGTPAAICLSIRDELEYATVSYDHDAIEKKDDAAGRHRVGIKEGLLTLPIAILSNFEEDLQILLKPCFDALARAGGVPGSPRYARRG